jgi:hypothetical protein
LVFGFWVLGLGVWGFAPNPKSPIPNPQSPIPKILKKTINFNKNINILIEIKNN